MLRSDDFLGDSDGQRQIRTITLPHVHACRVIMHSIPLSTLVTTTLRCQIHTNNCLKYCWPMIPPTSSYDYQYWYPPGKDQHKHKIYNADRMATNLKHTYTSVHAHTYLHTQYTHQ